MPAIRKKANEREIIFIEENHSLSAFVLYAARSYIILRLTSIINESPDHNFRITHVGRSLQRLPALRRYAGHITAHKASTQIFHRAGVNSNFYSLRLKLTLAI